MTTYFGAQLLEVELHYPDAHLDLLRERGVLIPKKFPFRPGIHCSGREPFGMSDQCKKAGCVGMEGINNLPGVALPCRKVLRGIGFNLAV